MGLNDTTPVPPVCDQVIVSIDSDPENPDTVAVHDVVPPTPIEDELQVTVVVVVAGPAPRTGLKPTRAKTDKNSKRKSSARPAPSLISNRLCAGCVVRTLVKYIAPNV